MSNSENKKPPRTSKKLDESQNLTQDGENTDGRFLDDYLLYLMARASHLVSSDFRNRLKQEKIGVPVWRVLVTLRHRDALTIGELGEFVLQQQSTLTKVIDRMTSDGLVDRQFSETDRRKVYVAITSKGREITEELLPLAIHHENQVMLDFSEEERVALKDMMKSLIARLA